MSVEVKVPKGRNPITIRTTVSAKWMQKVSIKPDVGIYVWTGQGEDGTVIGSTVEERRNGDRTFTVTAEHSEDGGLTWRPNQIRVKTVSSEGRPSVTVVTVSTEDGGDDDFDDSVTHFIY